MMENNKRQAFKARYQMTPLDARSRWMGHSELNVLAGPLFTNWVIANQFQPGLSTAAAAKSPVQ